MPPCNRIATRELIERDCATWPAELKARWIALFDPDGPFAEKPWVRESQYQYAGVFTRYLACCARHGLPAQISSQGLRAFIRECEKAGNVPRTIAGYVWQLSHVANLLQPELYVERGWLRQTAVRLQRVASRTPKKRTAHVVRAPDIGLLGERLIAQARAAARQDTWATTELFRNGLWLRLGVRLPERLKALSALQCSWIDLDARLIRFPAEVEKVPEQAQRALPEDLVEDIREWLARRAKRKPRHDFFWIAKGGKPAGAAALAAAMRRVTKNLTGEPISPHGFRHGAATFVVETAPDKAPLATIVLNQRSAAITREYTQRAKQIAASREGAALIAAGEARVRKAVRALTRSTIAHAPRKSARAYRRKARRKSSSSPAEPAMKRPPQACDSPPDPREPADRS